MMPPAAQIVRHLAEGHPGLALIAGGMERARAERLSYAYRVDRLWPTRVLRLALYVAIRAGTRLPTWTSLAAWNARRLPVLHKPLSGAYRRGLRPHPIWPQQSVDPVAPQQAVDPSPPRQAVDRAGPAQRRIRRRLELLRHSGSLG